MKIFVYELHDGENKSDNDVVWRMTDPNRRIFILTCREEEKKNA